MKKLKELGLKLTPQRIAILEYLEGNEEHPSAEDIYQAVSQKFPTMSLATIYNTLDTLRERGKVIELTTDPDKKRFDPNVDPHNHAICINCKKIVDIHTSFDLVIPEDARKGFEIFGNHIEFYGKCSQCNS